MKRTLIRGGHILSMDPNIGELPVGDILVEGDVIVEVAPSIEAGDAEIIDASGHIVTPGLIDTHKHLWQTPLRGSMADTTLFGYLCGVRFNAAAAFQPADVRLGTQLGALEALNAGQTTVLDFSHCVNTPDHADAALEGLIAAGIRAVLCYGFFECVPHAPLYFPDVDARVRDFQRFADTHFSGDPGLVTLGVALSEVGSVPLSSTRKEIAAARERGALIVTHTGCAWGFPNAIKELEEQNLLGSDQVHVHCNALYDDEWALLAKAGAKVSISVEAELNSGLGRPPFAPCARHEIKPTLSCDSNALVKGELLTQARMALAFKRWEDTEPLNLARKDPLEVSTTAYEALEWCTINGAEALGLQDSIGSLTPGKQADILIIGGPWSLGHHPRTHAAGAVVFQTGASDIRTILVGGRVVKRDGALVEVDLPKLLQQVDQAALDIKERGEAMNLEGAPQSAGDIQDLLKMGLANLQNV